MSNCIGVTGGTGYIGSRFIQNLAESNCEVRAFIRETSDPEPIIKMGLQPIVVDYSDSSSLSQSLHGVRMVVHIAGPGLSDLTTGKESSAEGVSSLIKACIECKVNRIIYLSSIKAGGPTGHDGVYVPEESRAPIDVYGDKKRREEELLRMNGNLLPWIALRIPAVYGPNDKKSLPLFKVTNWRVIPVLPTGSASRFSMIHVDRVIAALNNSMCPDINTNRIYEIADGDAVTWNILANWLSHGVAIRDTLPLFHSAYKCFSPTCTRSFIVLRFNQYLSGQTSPPTIVTQLPQLASINISSVSLFRGSTLK